jgi:tRNA A-37 threonylcarbamoyl transferase component Bud32
VPAGYRMSTTGNLSVVVKKGYAESFDGFVMPNIQADKDSDGARSGRGLLVPFPLSQNPSERALVRRCIRGGFFGRFFREMYLNWGTPRPIEELRVSDYARARGVSTPEVLAAAFEKAPPFFYRGALAVREISPSADLQRELLEAQYPLDRASLGKKRRAIASLGRLIAKMHEAGIYHADLHLKNILLSDADGGLYVLDLDAAKICEPLSDFRKHVNLLRLYRSAEKVNQRRRIITRTDLMRFLRSYAGEPQSARELAEQLLKMSPLWRLKWAVSDFLGV